MPFRYNIIGQTQPQTCALSGRLGGKKGVEDFFADGFKHLLYFLMIAFFTAQGMVHQRNQISFIWQIQLILAHK